MKRFLSLVSTLLIAGVASAQDAFDARVADLGLLQAKQIQTDMKVTEAQRTKMNAAAQAHTARVEAYKKTMQGLGTMTPDKAREKALVDQLKKEVFAALSPAQLRRLRELTLQRVGLLSMTDPEVSKRVGLNGAQVEKLKAAFQAGRTKFQALQNQIRGPILAPYQGKKPKDQAEAKRWQAVVVAKLKAAEPAAKPKLEAVGKATDAAMLAVLTPAQRATWAALKGPAFKAK